MHLLLQAIDEDRPGAQWRRNFDRHWHPYSRWFLHEGIRQRRTYADGLKAIRRHMPELEPLYSEICELAGGGDLEARFLSMWCPPAYVGGCSQLVLTDPQPLLIRNYDYSPRLFEGVWLASRFHGKRVVSMIDCLWGVLDGINEDGLAVSLSFGGRTALGEGFGIPIILRYVLEFASNLKEALAMLQRVPVHMSYSVSLIDRSGDYALVYVTPDRPIEVMTERVATNHQHQPEWLRHAEATRSLEREDALCRAVEAGVKPEEAAALFLTPPLYQTGYAQGYGTLYTAIYEPVGSTAELRWPGSSWKQSCALFEAGERQIIFGGETSQ